MPSTSIWVAWISTWKRLSDKFHAHDHSAGLCARPGASSAPRSPSASSPLAHSLEYKHPGAASLRGGLEEMLTVAGSVSGALHRSLRTTHLSESLNSSIETYTRNVKRWRGGVRIQRWVSAALLDAEKRLRRVRGHRDLRWLVTALNTRAQGVPETARVA